MPRYFSSDEPRPKLGFLFKTLDEKNTIYQPLILNRLRLKEHDLRIGKIIWETTHSPEYLEILGGFTMEAILTILRSAAMYAAGKATNSTRYLIGLSLGCLLSSLEVLHVKDCQGLDILSHMYCNLPECRIGSVRKLTSQISNYTTRISIVFSKKDNMRNVREWWLSAFYSFCIQSFVRRVLLLLHLEDSEGTDSEVPISAAADQYLFLALRGFVAYSKTYDPLIGKGRIADKTSDDYKDIQAAKRAVDQEPWEARGIRSSGEYLKQLFGDHGQKLQEPAH